MKKILVAFIRDNDIRDVDSSISDQSHLPLGPIGSTVAKIPLDRIILINSKSQIEFGSYVNWLKSITKAHITTHQAPDGINWKILLEAYKECLGTLENNENLYIFSSPGSSFDSESFRSVVRQLDYYVLESQKKCEIKVVRVPFGGGVYKSVQQDFALENFYFDASQVAPEFKNIIHRSRKMAGLIEKATIVALNRATVLIQGESGTGKELLARAIHRVSSQSDGPLKTVNCGVIPSELVESEFFVHIKGSFTGARFSGPIGQDNNPLGLRW